jgi:hypothetical protein
VTTIQEQAIELIRELPDEKVYYLVGLLKSFRTPENKEHDINESFRAYQELQKYRREGSTDRDYKAEMHSIWEERYEGID